MKIVKNTWENTKTHPKILKNGSHNGPRRLPGLPGTPLGVDPVFGHIFSSILAPTWPPFWLPFGLYFGAFFNEFSERPPGTVLVGLGPDFGAN